MKSSASAAWSQVPHTLFESPIQATVRPRIEPRCSMKVNTSARTWQGWNSFVSPLITGTRELAAKRSTIACSKVRIITMSHIREITCAASSTGSPRPSCESRVFM